MGDYQAQRNFRGSHGAGSFLFYTGDLLDLNDDDAAWIEQTEPGTLVAAPDDPAVRKPAKARRI